ncbi:nucleotidyltransferase domain-containing protein [bacterium]|nr:nucleotidyltransferase domain-containing protein [bacterium]
MKPHIHINQEKIVAFCRKWKITEFSFFGSVLREDFGPDSDVDVLVTFSDDARWSLFDIVHMEDELKEIFGRIVDIAERKAIERSENYIVRRRILSNAKAIYGP